MSQTVANGKIVVSFPSLGVVRFHPVGRPDSYLDRPRLLAAKILRILKK